MVPTETLIGHLWVNAGKPNSVFYPIGPHDAFLWTAHGQNVMGLAHRTLFGPHSVSPTVQGPYVLYIACWYCGPQRAVPQTRAPRGSFCSYCRQNLLKGGHMFVGVCLISLYYCGIFTLQYKVQLLL